MAFVYAIQAAEGGPVKLGRTACPRSRLAQIQTCHPSLLAFIGLSKGDSKLESKLHKELKPHNIRGEWFSPAEDVMEAIAQLGLLTQYVGRRPVRLATPSLAKSWREKGLTYQKIGDKLGVSRQRVHQLCRMS